MTPEPPIRGAAVGDPIPGFETAPISRVTLALFAGASGDPNPIHIDIDYAREAGMDDVFVHGMLLMAYLGRMLTNWAPQTALRDFRVRFVSIARVHERVLCSGTVSERFHRDGEDLVRLELRVVNQDKDLKLAGEAVVAAV